MNRLIISLALLGIISPSHAQPLESMAFRDLIEAFDTPGDAGKSITLTWPRSEVVPPDAVYLVSIATAPDSDFHLAAEISAKRETARTIFQYMGTHP